MTKQIQLADENKNWINWRYYNPEYGVTHDFCNTPSATSYTLSITKPGLYCLTTCHDAKSSVAVFTTGNTIHSYEATTPTGYKIYAERIIYSSQGNDSLTLTSISTGNAARFLITLIYIGTFSNIYNPQHADLMYSTNSQTANYNTANQFVHFVTVGSQKYEHTFLTNDIEPNHISIQDNYTSNAYSAAALISNSGGSVNCSGTPGVENNSGGLFFSSYVVE